MDDFSNMSKYVDFTNLDDILADLTTEEAKEMEDIENKYGELFKKWKLEEVELQPNDPPENWDKEGYLPINDEETKEWSEYEERGSKEWHNKRSEWFTINDAFNEERHKFYNKFQERRFTEIIKKIGIKKFFQDRIKGAEEAIKKVVEENNKKDSNRIYTEYGINRIIENYKEIIETSKETLMKIEAIKKEDINDLSFSEILEIINIKALTEEKEEIELLDSIIPKNYIIPNNRLVNKMIKGEVLYNNEFDLRINGETKKEILTKVSLNYDDENIQIYDKDKRFTPYDRTVHNAICSLYEAGNVNFTPEQVYRCMNGLDDSQYVSPQAVGAITKSLDKSRRIYTKVDYTNEAKAYKKNINNCIIEDYILSAKKVVLEAGGHKVTGYKLNSKPILYEYAQVTGQVLTVPSKLLNTKDVIRSTPEVTIIREYLIRRIEVMKKNNNQSNSILLDRIYEEISQPDPTKEKAKKVRDIVEKLLGKFITEKYIKKFEFYKEGRAFKGIEIFY